MKSGIQVADTMSINLISVSKDTTLTKCAKMMRDSRLGAVIIKENDVLLGILTEKDIVRKAVADGIDINIAKVVDYMKTNLVTVNPGADIYDAIIKMRDNNIRRLPVVDGNKVLGLLTIKSILKIEPQLFELIKDKFELEEEKGIPLSRVVPAEGICQSCGKYSENVKEIDGTVVCENCDKT